MQESVRTIPVLDQAITALPRAGFVERCVRWAQDRASRYVCVANVHMVMEAHWSPEFAQVLAEADFVTPDGMPLVWVMRLMGAREQERVAGLDLMEELLKALEAAHLSVFLFGATAEVLQRMQERMRREFPALQIAGAQSPPFRPLTSEEDEAIVAQINESGARVLLVALGCPKQERWMHVHRGRVHAVMLGLGGAFPVYAGLAKRAPAWVRNAGLEWIYRLVQEPSRLWRRYAQTNLPFLILALRQILGQKKSPTR